MVMSCAALMACGGGSSGGGGGSGDGGDSSGTLSLDAQDYIYSYSASANLSSRSLSPKEYTAAPGEAGGFSRSGCEADMLQQQIIRRSKFSSMIQCYMEFMEDYGGVTLDSDWTVFNVSMPEDSGPEEAEGGSFLMRVRKHAAGIYDMDACFGGQLRTEMRTSASGSGCIVSVIDEGDWGSGSLEIVLEGACNVDNYTSATFTEEFVDTEFGSYGSTSLSADNSSDVNVVSGAFANESENDSSNIQVYAQFDATSGSAKHDSSGTYTAQSASDMMESYLEQGVVDCNNQAISSSDYLCCEGPGGDNCSQEEGGCFVVASGTSCSFDDSGVESFSITPVSENSLEFKVSSENSSFYAAVNAQDLTAVPSQPTIAFADNWDCDSSGAIEIGQSDMMAGGTAAMAAMQVCMGKEQDMDDFQDNSLCQNTEDTQREEWDQQ